MNFEELIMLLKSLNTKVTPARLAILTVIDKAERHLSIDEIYERAAKEVPNIGIATTYRTVKMLCEADLLIKHGFDNCEPLYEKRESKKHSHLIDVDTKEVLEFECESIKKELIKIAKTKGYELVDYKIEVYGEKISG